MDKEQKRLPRKILNTIITISVVAAILLLNVLLCVLAYKNLWNLDLSMPKYKEMEKFFTMSDSFKEVMEREVISSIDKINSEREGESLKVNIIFCQDSDKLDKNQDTRLVHYTARTLAAKYPDYFELSYTDVVKNPSSVQKYKVTSATSIFPTDVIISFGTEFNVHGLSSFYMTDTDTGETWGYNGEKKIAATVLSLTRAESPICALTTNHGEALFDYNDGNISVKEEYSAFIKILEGAGYEVQLLNLETQPIPEDCRMIICFAPTKDFAAYGSLGESGISEISKLDKYLDEAKSFFYISNEHTPVLENLEEYLTEWGIAPGRELLSSGIYDSYKLFDKKNSIGSDPSQIIGNYATTGYGSTITSDLRKNYPPTVVFGGSSVVTPSPAYDRVVIYPKDEDDVKSVIYSYYNNGITRTMYDVFTSYPTAYVGVGDEVRYANENFLYSLFTLTEEAEQIQEDSLSMVSLSSYVLSVSSTEFFNNKYLDSASYGNSDVLLSALRATGTETVPVNVDAKAIYNDTINDTLYMTLNTRLPTVLLAAIPFVLVICAGIVACVRRKYL